MGPRLLFHRVRAPPAFTLMDNLTILCVIRMPICIHSRHVYGSQLAKPADGEDADFLFQTKKTQRMGCGKTKGGELTFCKHSNGVYFVLQVPAVPDVAVDFLVYDELEPPSPSRYYRDSGKV